MRPLPRYWRGFFFALCGAALIGLAVVLAWPSLAGLYLLGLYSVPANSFLSLPHEPAVLYFARYYHPAWVALAGALGTAVAAFADYDLMTRVMHHPRTEVARATRAYRWAVHRFNTRPFVTIVVFACTPLPLYVVRILAPATGYPLRRYIAALIVGRYPRFLLLAWFGHAFPMPTWALLAMFAAMVALILVSALVRRRRRPQRSSGAATGEPSTDADGPQQPDDNSA